MCVSVVLDVQYYTTINNNNILISEEDNQLLTVLLSKNKIDIFSLALATGLLS